MFELIYTSYPKGLQIGTSGFTTVAHTEGMPKAYIQLCESLSGYPFIYPLGHPLYENNPEIYSHYKFKIRGGAGFNANSDPNLNTSSNLNRSGDQNGVGVQNDIQEVSILSRVAASGSDYTGRENKIAHHIVLDSSEKLSCIQGPAWLMRHSDLFVPKWEQNPCLLKPKKTVDAYINSTSEPPDIDQQRRLSKELQNIFDGINPALIVARASEQNLETPLSERALFILFDLEDQTVPYQQLTPIFVDDALKFVPPEKRWDITFNTYFISKPMDSECLWRFVPTQRRRDKAPLQSAASHINFAQNIIEKYPDSLVIDLANKTVHGKIPADKEGGSIKEKSETALNFPNDSNLSSSGAIASDKLSSDSNSDLSSLSDSRLQDKFNKEHLDTVKAANIKRYRLWILLSLFTAIAAALIYILCLHYLPQNKSSISNSKKADIKTNQIKSVPTETDSHHNANNLQNSSDTLPNSAKQVDVKNSKKMILSFYDDIDKTISTIAAQSSDLKLMKCALIRNDGTEIGTKIESPIADDTPNWDIIPEGINEPAGNISIGSISLYDKGIYSAIYLELLEREEGYMIWRGAVKIDSEMISEGGEADALDIRFSSEMSELLPKLLSIISSENLTAVVELQTSDDSSSSSSSSSGGGVSSSNNGGGAEADKSIFYPVCSIKNEKQQDLEISFIQLKFSSDDFNSILKSGEKDNNSSSDLSSKAETTTEIKTISATENSGEIIDKTNGQNANLFKQLKLKEIRIDYTDKDSSQKYPFLCFSCNKKQQF
ncbi:MAG: hypothetical protein AB7U45_12165 [Desulfamplus sp.]